MASGGVTSASAARGRRRRVDEGDDHHPGQERPLAGLVAEDAASPARRRRAGDERGEQQRASGMRRAPRRARRLSTAKRAKDTTFRATTGRRARRAPIVDTRRSGATARSCRGTSTATPVPALTGASGRGPRRAPRPARPPAGTARPRPPPAGRRTCVHQPQLLGARPASTATGPGSGAWRHGAHDRVGERRRLQRRVAGARQRPPGDHQPVRDREPLHEPRVEVRREHGAVAPARLPQRAQAAGDAAQRRLGVAHTRRLLEAARVAQGLRGARAGAPRAPRRPRAAGAATSATASRVRGRLVLARGTAPGSGPAGPRRTRPPPATPPGSCAGRRPGAGASAARAPSRRRQHRADEHAALARRADVEPARRRRRPAAGRRPAPGRAPWRLAPGRSSAIRSSSSSRASNAEPERA